MTRFLRATTLSTLAAFLAFGLVPTASAQTPNATVENEGGDVRLQTFYNGGLLAPGTVVTDGTESDSIPATGGGTRMMWYPEKAAFRAGRVGVFKDGTQWDPANVGRYSVAFGLDTEASGADAMAMGLATIASGAGATAMGEGTAAATTASLSIGQFNSANTSSDGTLFVAGNGSSGSRSDAMVLDTDGNLAVSGSFELPDGTVLSGDEDLGVPTNSNGAFDLSNDDGVVASGTFTSGSIPTEGAGTRMMWYPEEAAFRAGRVGADLDGTQWDAGEVGNYSVAFGVDTEASGFAATAIGEQTTASGFQSTAMGRLTTASGSRATAMGFNTTASGVQTTAMGTGTEAANGRSLSLGVCNSANTSIDGTLLAVGNGSYDSQNDNCSSRDDAFTVDDQGSATAASHDTFSDRRLKTGIEPLGEGTLTKLAALQPVRYRFRDQQTRPSGEQLGLIAQDVQEEFPSLVSEGSGGMLSLAYPKLTAVLLKGLQEQQTRLEKQQSTIEEQNERIDRLEERLAALEEGRSSSLPAGLVGPWALGLLLGLGGLAVGLLWRRRGSAR